MNDAAVSALLTGVATVATTTLVGLGGVGLALMRKKLGLQQTQNDMLAEKNARDKLQATLVTAVGMYALGNKEQALNYVLEKAADATTLLNVSPDEISTLLVNKAAAWAGVQQNVPTLDTTALSQGIAPRA